MIKLSDIRTTVEYDKPYPGYVEVHCLLEVHGVATVREKDPVRRAKMIEDAKHLASRQVWNRVYDIGEIAGYLADLEHLALMNPHVRPEETREIIRKIYSLLERGE